MHSQGDFFADTPPAFTVPGLTLVEEAITCEQERDYAAAIDVAPLAPFRFGQWEGKRLTVNYGSAYDYARGKVTDAPDFPAWLEALKHQLAPLFDLDPAALRQALLIRYDPGAGIGWHRDRPQYGDVLGLSLSAPAVLRLRQRQESGGFRRHTVPLARRSAYRLSGKARQEWEHSIVPMEVTRHSITLRTMR
ncbi:alpha-ketoglutarate-dependent dioxygenase AlkB [Altererythrobacter endophyticus]|uniref:Alpha-ketoglutarate-dependent dioxygenase AlkB n=2 Tax=Altericroceibacterium endophyticum TaxID=1808508 RepID=A0A6I4T9C4_9SPHN|nr:alpha-ketoglutarate-dependent dioxygenase AlkB [Altericroceibacterium endophyticum]